MCTKVKCSSCGKATYAGCGQHIEEVLAGVPESERCRCHEEKQTKDANKPRCSWWPF
jgi:hypothetical protein